MNSINIIKPYRMEGIWVFDDPSRGLDREPFVSSAGEIIDSMVANIPRAEEGFCLMFSDSRFPDANVRLDWVETEMDGNWYKCHDSGATGWLCPALLKYFKEPPKTIWAAPFRRVTEEDLDAV